jgi:hypothetical protein
MHIQRDWRHTPRWRPNKLNYQRIRSYGTLTRLAHGPIIFPISGHHHQPAKTNSKQRSVHRWCGWLADETDERKKSFCSGIPVIRSCYQPKTHVVISAEGMKTLFSLHISLVYQRMNKKNTHSAIYKTQKTTSKMRISELLRPENTTSHSSRTFSIKIRIGTYSLLFVLSFSLIRLMSMRM